MKDLATLRAEAKTAREAYETAKRIAQTEIYAGKLPSSQMGGDMQSAAASAWRAQNIVAAECASKGAANSSEEQELARQLKIRSDYLFSFSQPQQIVDNLVTITTGDKSIDGLAANADRAYTASLAPTPVPAPGAAAPTLEDLREAAEEARSAFDSETVGFDFATAQLAQIIQLRDLARTASENQQAVHRLSGDSDDELLADKLEQRYSLLQLRASELTPGYVRNPSVMPASKSTYDSNEEGIAQALAALAAPAVGRNLDELRKDARMANMGFNGALATMRAKYMDNNLTGITPEDKKWLSDYADYVVEMQQSVVDHPSLVSPSNERANEDAIMTVFKERKQFWNDFNRGAETELKETKVRKVAKIESDAKGKINSADELTFIDKTWGEFMHHGYMSGTTSTTGQKTEHFIYNPLYPALNIIGRPFVDWGFQLKAAWDKKPYLVPVVALLGLPVNILNHVSPFKIDFNFPFLHLGTPQMPPIIRDFSKAVSNLASLGCNVVGLVGNALFKGGAWVCDKVGKELLDPFSKFCDTKPYDNPVGAWQKFANAITWPVRLIVAPAVKALAVPVHVAGKALDATGSIVQNACAIAGSACQVFVHPKEAIKGVGRNLVDTSASVVQGVGEVVKESGLQLNQFANTANIPVVSNAIKVGGNVLAAAGVGIEGLGVGTKLFARGEGKEGGAVIGAGMGAGAKTIYEGFRSPEQLESVRDLPKYLVMPNKDTGNKIASTRMGLDQIDAAELIKGTKINTSLMTASKQAEVDAVRDHAKEIREKERGEDRISR